jgi:protein-S-isoprenylcysteine O-methyltransferase Ste14
MARTGFWRLGWWLFTWGMMGLRTVIALQFIQAGGAGVAFGLLEAAALGFATRNLVVAKFRDYSLTGSLVPILYVAGLIVVPRGLQVTVPGALLVLASVGLSTWALVHLNARFTVGGSSWVSLVDRGPYAWIRHPQQAARLLMIGAILTGATEGEQIFRLAAAGIFAVLVVCIEEQAIVAIGDYADYRERVRWAFVPGVL